MRRRPGKKLRRAAPSGAARLLRGLVDMPSQTADVRQNGANLASVRIAVALQAVCGGRTMVNYTWF